MMIFYTTCPCCNGESVAKVFSAKDFTVSNEEYEIWHCKDCTARFTQNIPDKTEIQRYYNSENYISHSDTKQGFINSLYHIVRKQTLIAKTNLIKKSTKLSKGKILDIGAGTGAFLHQMELADWSVTGLEPDESARENSKRLYGLSLYAQEKLFDLPEQTFDAVTLWHVLEHVHDIHLYFDQIKKILKPAGYMFIAVPNYTSYDAEVYREFWAGYDVPRHLYHFSPTAVTQLLLQHGLQLKRIKPMWYDSFYVSMLSEKNMTGKNNFLKSIVNGYISNCKALLDNEKCSSIIYIITH